MAFKFLRIGAANAEIEKLAADNAALAKERDELRATIESNASETTKAAEELQKQVAAQAESLASLTAERDGLKAELDSTKERLTEAEEQLANPAAQIVKIASTRAAEITASQGQPPLQTAPAGPAGASPNSVEDLMGQIQAISDPTARTMFYRKHAAAFAAARNSRNQ
jgi:chromosome segregation ATPase